MTRKRKLTAVKLNTKLMVDIVGASLIVQQVPALLQKWFGLDSTVSKIGAVGVGYVVGSMFDRPDLSNASIALFATDMILPVIGGILPNDLQVPAMLPAGKIPMPMPPAKQVPAVSLDDYFRLNDYISTPGTSAPFQMYRDSY